MTALLIDSMGPQAERMVFWIPRGVVLKVSGIIGRQRTYIESVEPHWACNLEVAGSRCRIKKQPPGRRDD